jgi:single-stranded DNA-binding protein
VLSGGSYLLVELFRPGPAAREKVDDMDVRTGESLAGYVASDPQLAFTSRGEARFYARIGQEQVRKLDDGSYETTGTEYADVVMYRKTAEHAFDKLRKGDNIVIGGYTHKYERGLPDGTVEPREEFVGTTFGPDGARSRYTVDRTPRRTPGIDQDAAAEQNLVPGRERNSGPASSALAL